jgi:ABC-2 type transport system ATP-binding protein
MTHEEIILSVHDLAKTFHVGFWRKKVHAVRGVSFSVRRGEVFAIVGPNGAGKTTTLKMLTGLVHPDSGSASLFGAPTGGLEGRRRLGYLPENPYFYEHLSAPELLRYYGHLHGMDNATIDARSKTLIEQVGLGHAGDRPLRKFSKGMRQRAGLAQALINDPELVILDEPQSGLDPVGRKEVRDLIFDLKRRGKTVILSSHILPDVEAVCDRVAVFNEGLVREIGTLHELTSERTQYIEILVRHLRADDHAVRALGGLELAEPRGGVLLLRMAGDVDLRATLDALYDAGATIDSVTPHKESLEDVFIRDTTDLEEE